jgi:hypothetical protein
LKSLTTSSFSLSTLLPNTNNGSHLSGRFVHWVQSCMRVQYIASAQRFSNAHV